MNKDMINSVVAENIDFKKPEDGEFILRLVNLAKERNIEYNPSHAACQSVHAYCLRVGIPPPEGLGGVDGPVPKYVPQPVPLAFDPNIDQPPPQGGGGNMPVFQP